MSDQMAAELGRLRELLARRRQADQEQPTERPRWSSVAVPAVTDPPKEQLSLLGEERSPC